MLSLKLWRQLQPLGSFSQNRTSPHLQLRLHFVQLLQPLHGGGGLDNVIQTVPSSAHGPRCATPLSLRNRLYNALAASSQIQNDNAWRLLHVTVV